MSRSWSRWLLATGLVAALGLWAWGWQGTSTEHLYVLLPEGVPDPAGLAAEAEEVLQAVWELWLPQGMETQLPQPDMLGAISPELLEEARREAGLPPPAGPSFGVLVYDDPEQLWREIHRFGISGIYLIPYPSLGDLGDRLRERFSRAGAPEGWGARGVILAYCPHGDCPAILAHEFTHGLQDYMEMQIPTDFCPEELDREPRLVIEGMARWTEFALGLAGDFDLLVRGPVAVWLEGGGSLDEVPEFLLYEIGASLFQSLSSRLSPPQILALFSQPARGLLGLMEGEFPALFRQLYGASWQGFLSDWRGWILATPPPPGADLVYEERRLGIGLRESFLWPLLSPEERGEIEGIRQAIRRGEGTAEGLRRADAVLQGAWAEPNQEVIAAVDARTASLRDWARAISGPQASARVSALWLIKNAEPDHPERYLQAFVEAVNTYLISPAPSPLGVPILQGNP